jgi:hypothetical protein
MTDHPWRPPVEEALAMADAFREGVPLGYQRAFVTLADAYLEAIADEPIRYSGEQADDIGQDMIRELRERRVEPDPLTPFAYAIDKKAIADADRHARRVLLAALALAITVAVLVHFFG